MNRGRCIRLRGRIPLKGPLLRPPTAPPDGYTLLLGSSGSLTINPVFSPLATIDPLRDFSYTSLMSSVPMVLSVHPSVPARSVQEFIALAKARPGRLTMGSAGV